MVTPEHVTMRPRRHAVLLRGVGPTLGVRSRVELTKVKSHIFKLELTVGLGDPFCIIDF